MRSELGKAGKLVIFEEPEIASQLGSSAPFSRLIELGSLKTNESKPWHVHSW
jgi:hypothetical protein